MSSLSRRVNARTTATSPCRCRATSRRCSTAIDAAIGGTLGSQAHARRQVVRMNDKLDDSGFEVIVEPHGGFGAR